MTRPGGESLSATRFQASSCVAVLPFWTPPGARHRDVLERDRSEAEVTGDHHALHLVRALADLEDLLVAVQARDRELLHEPVAAVDLEGGVDDAVREQAREELRLRRRERERLARVLEPRRPVDEL